MQWFSHDSLDPTFNLALEEALLTQMEPNHPGYALLWQNAPTVVVGRFQNTRQEVDHEVLNARNIGIVRRLTGGGAVYHDAGTLNYTFIQHLQNDGTMPAFNEAARPIAEALCALGFPVVFSGRNDLLLEGSKVAGVANCRQGRKLLHHGCILVNTQLSVLGEVLRPDPEKFQSKGVASVRSRVTNLADYAPLDTHTLREAILATSHSTVHTLLDSSLPGMPKCIALAERLRDTKYATWDWIYGASPPFTECRKHRFKWGKIEAYFDVRRGHVATCTILGDIFGDVAPLERALSCIPYTHAAFAEALANPEATCTIEGCNPEELLATLAPQN